MLVKIPRLTMDQLILSNVHLGDRSDLINVKMKPYLLGHKNESHVLNISFSIIHFRLLIKLVLNIISLRQKILVVKELDFLNFGNLLNFNSVFYYNKKWIGGVLTNFRVVRRSDKFLNENTFSNTLAFLRYMPSLVLLFDTNISKWPLFESYNLEIPVASLINSSSNFTEFVDYPLLANNQSFESVFLYVNLLKNAIIAGRQKERLNILRIL